MIQISDLLPIFNYTTFSFLPDNSVVNQFWGGLNAYLEKSLNHFIYKFSAMSRRCIVPLTGFFEPHTDLKKFKLHRNRKNSRIKVKNTLIIRYIYNLE